MLLELSVVIISLFGLSAAGFFYWRINRIKVIDEKAKQISQVIREGAMAFLNKEYRVLIIFAVVVAVLLYFFINPRTAAAFVLGAFLSGLAGNIGMRVATLSNVRTAEAVKDNIKKGLQVAFDSGSVMGLAVVSLGLLGIVVLYYLFRDPQIIYGFGFGASSIAIFARVGGGIYTKAADIGADLVGKIEAGIPEDDPRNPATIADNVGDNVGDVAGMGADLFESYVDSIIVAMVLGALGLGIFGAKAVVLPLVIAGGGILASLIGNLIIRLIKKGEPHNILNAGILSASGVMIIFSYLATKYLVNQSLALFFAILIGLVAGLIIGFITEFYTSAKYKPTKELSKASETGAATNIISGLALGMQSTIVPVLVIAAAILGAYKLGGLFGIAMAAVGMLSTLGITLATDCYGPVADNAAGIAEMAKMGQQVRERAEELDAVGNTTAAIGKGLAIGSAALTALVLSISYAQVAGLQFINLNSPFVLSGLFIGGLLPFVFSAFAMKAVGRAAYAVVNEVRRQFKEIVGLKEGTAKPEYGKCVSIVTSAALRQMILPSLIAILTPLLVGVFLGKEALGGLLTGSVITGFLLAIMMANSGGAWDNAKKYIEAGNFGGKGSKPHEAAVIGDTVGDPFKDTAGPSLNILIKLISIIAIIIAPLL